MQAIDGCELFREIERRTEMIDAAIDVVGILDAPEIGR
jgi:hypothetical protein